MYDRFDELVRHIGIVAGLHRFVHRLKLCTFAAHEQVVGFLYTLPAFITVHGVESSADAGYLAAGLLLMGFQRIDESYARTRVGVAAIHEAVYERPALQAILLGYVAEVKEVVERTVHTAVTGQTHDMQIRAVLLGITEGGLNLGVLHD